MKRRSYGRDAGLTLRMIFTTGLLGLLYVLFAVVLFYFLNVGLVPMLVIVVGIAFFQYYTSDKLALLAAGAKVIERSQAPELFDLVEELRRLAALDYLCAGGQQGELVGGVVLEEGNPDHDHEHRDEPDVEEVEE